jgi:hypothetical protein
MATTTMTENPYEGITINAPPNTQRSNIASQLNRAFGRDMAEQGGGPGGLPGAGNPGGNGPPHDDDDDEAPPPQGPGAQQQAQANRDIKAMGQLPQSFDGNRERAEDFIEEVQAYLCLNRDVPGYNNPYKKVTFTTTLLKGPLVAEWA